MDKFFFETLESTQSTALDYASKRFLRQNLEPFYIFSDEQIFGKGTREKLWHSPKGNLYVTFGFFLNESIMSGFSLWVGLKIRQSLQKFIPNLPIKLKWVNDIFLSDRKLGGILINQDNFKNYYFVRIGIGLNLTEAPKFKNAYQSISLFDAGYFLERDEFLDELALEFQREITLLGKGSFEKHRNEWLENALYFNQEIKFQTETQQITGLFKDISLDGHIGIEDSEGINYYASGQIVL